MKTKASQAEQLMVPFLLAGGDPNWVPRTPVMGFKRFEPKAVDTQQAPRSRRGRRAAPIDPVLSETSDNDFE